MPEIVNSPQVPLETANGDSLFMIFCRESGVISEHNTITDAVRAMVRHLQAHPNSAVGLYRRGDQSWTLQ